MPPPKRPIHLKHLGQHPSPSKKLCKNSCYWDFTGCPVVKYPPSCVEDGALIPGLRNKIPHAEKQLLSPCATKKDSRCHNRPNAAKQINIYIFKIIAVVIIILCCYYMPITVLGVTDSCEQNTFVKTWTARIPACLPPGLQCVLS